jgi:tRNA dimethylallyltransferase
MRGDEVTAMARQAGRRDEGVCWVLVGPTASGKSAVALELARRRPTEIVSVDSMQVYCGMDIGTAKPTPQERALVPHHMVDVLDPGEQCNVGRFCRMARLAIREIRARGNRPLIVGGAPLYLKGLLWGLMEAPSGDAHVRARLKEELARHGRSALHERLAVADPEAAARIHPNDVQRLLRALEVCELTGLPISAGQRQFSGRPRLSHRLVGLRRQRAELYARIERRVDETMAQGLLAEVESLRGRLGPQAGQALGYKELTDHLDGRISLDDAVRLIKRNTRRYAKHQLTWFRHFGLLQWVDAGPGDSPAEVADRCEALLSRPA